MNIHTYTHIYIYIYIYMYLKFYICKLTFIPNEDTNIVNT